MRRAIALLSVALVGLVGFAALGAAQEGTPAAEEEGMPEGITFEFLGLGEAPALPTGPLDLQLFRIGLAPGAGFPLDPADPAAALVVVEAGALTVQAEAPLTVLRAAGPEGPSAESLEAFGAGEEITLETGDSIVFTPGIAGEVRNDGTEEVRALVSNVVPLGAGEAGAATPAP